MQEDPTDVGEPPLMMLVVVPLDDVQEFRRQCLSERSALLSAFADDVDDEIRKVNVHGWHRRTFC